MTYGHLVTAINGAILASVYFFAPDPLPRLMLVWFLLVLLLSIVRYGIYRTHRSQGRAWSTARKEAYFVGSHLASGILWALPAPLMIPNVPDISWYLAIPIVQTAMIAGAVSILCANRAAFYAFAIPVLIALAACYQLLGSGGIAYLLVIAAFAKLLHSAERNSYKLVRADLLRQYEMKRLLNQLVESKESAEAANKAKGDFLANMSHEIRTPMNGVIGALKLLQEDELNNRQSHLLNTSLSSAESLLKLLSEILDLSKIEAGKFELEQSSFSVSALVQEVASLYQPLAIRKGVRFTAIVPEDAPPWVCGDNLRLKQVLSNIVGNAIKFTQQGKIQVEVTFSSIVDEQVRVHFAVADSGVGIASDKLETIFNAFDQADTSTTRNFGGTGLGLYISARLLGSMDGDIGVESEPGKGSLFWFEVPLVLASPPLQDPRLLEADIEALSAIILLVEDNKVNQLVAKGLLEKKGLTVLVAADGVEALAMLKTEPVDLVLMDCQMPNMDGYEATRSWRAIEQTQGKPPLPIVALTANAMKGDREKCLDAGMSDYLSKPIDQAELVAKLHTWLNQGVDACSATLEDSR